MYIREKPSRQVTSLTDIVRNVRLVNARVGVLSSPMSGAVDCSTPLKISRWIRRGASGGALIALQPQVFDLLEYVIRNRERVVIKDDLLAAVWNGRIVSESTLSTPINAERRGPTARPPSPSRSALNLHDLVARISSRAQSASRSHIYVRRTYSGRPSSSMRFSDATAMLTSVVCRPSVRERSASLITRL